MNQESMHANLSENAIKNINDWLSQDKYAEYRSDLLAMIENEEWHELENSFFKVLEFGTAGRRGSVGLGSNRVNRVTIGECAQALCEYAAKFDEKAHEKGIVIACDTRLTSPELSQYAARVCAANGFRTYIFEDYRATPELSFAVRLLGAAAGIVISASHNPPQDNGFKAYWSDGAQVIAPHDKGILEAATEISMINALEDFDKAVDDGKITILSREVDEAYIQAILNQSQNKLRDVRIVYSPLHGAGQTNALPALQKAGFDDVMTVDLQMTPDGNFPNVANHKPNPEEREANALAAEMLRSSGADMAITNDPDADRIGVMVRQGSEIVYLNGNQTAALATDFLLSSKKRLGELSENDYIVKTFVTTDTMDALAKKYNVKIYNNLPIGFKYIGEIIRNNENADGKFIIGAEESYGLLAGDYARDKDGGVAALVLAELAAELKSQNKTLVDHLYDIYSEVGLFVEVTKSVAYPGAEGFATMSKIMQAFKNNPPKSIGNHKVSAVRDYSTLTRHLADGSTEPINSTACNVVVLEFDDYSRRVTIRPSGTEPKMKFYTQWHQESTENPRADKEHLESLLIQLSDELAKTALEII